MGFFPFFSFFLSVMWLYTGQARFQRQDRDQSHTVSMESVTDGNGVREPLRVREESLQRSNASSETGSMPVLSLRVERWDSPCACLPPYLPLSQTKPTIRDTPPRTAPSAPGPSPQLSNPTGGARTPGTDASFPAGSCCLANSNSPVPQRVSLKWILCLLQHPGWGLSPPLLHPGGTHKV